ncbi:MAG TPA: hypothetical protein VLG66_18015 [Alphaproteobacteria bacterium]|nr:hypothetical protein [Alphaproteobacteria bacterium]
MDGNERVPDVAVVAYKRLLRAAIDNRPAGVLRRVAEAIGKNRSFVTQITSPDYPAPVPARYVETIFSICHFTADEKRAFLAAYRDAHPDRDVPVADEEFGRPERVIEIRVPAFADRAMQRKIEDTIREFAARLIEIALKR